MSKEEEFIKEIGQSWKDILDNGGITHEYLRKKLQEELDYKEPGKKKPSYKAMRIRQPARQDAHKLRGDYPAEEHRFTGEIVNPRTPEEQKAIQEVAKLVAKAIRDKKSKP